MKEIRLSFQTSIVLKQTDVHWIEEELLRIRERVFLEILKKIMVEIERDTLKGARVCERCGSPLVRNGQEAKKIKTLVGVVEVSRVRFRCQSCKEDIYPLDRAIGLGCGERVTLGVKERSLWAAVEVSYEKASQFLEKFTGLEVSRNKVHKMALEEGVRVGEWEEDKRREVFEEGRDVGCVKEEVPEVLYIQVDGTGVNNRASKEWMECKVGASFSQRVLVSKGRVWLMDKRSYASIENVEAFGEKFFLDCVKQGVLQAKKVFFIGDGARWIRGVKERYFPDAIGVLDSWHLEGKLKKALGEERKDMVKSCMDLAFKGMGVELIKYLMRLSQRASGLEETKRFVDVMSYVRENLDWIGNIPKVGGYGSGPVEKTVDITVARRLKKRGMSWYRGGANPLLKLRLLKLNGEWDTYWQERREGLAQYAA